MTNARRGPAPELARPIRTGLLLLCGLAALACRPAQPPAAPAAAAAPPLLRVMSFNIRLDNGRDGENGWSFRRPGVQGMLPFHRIDVAGLQEVLPNQHDDLVGALPEYGWLGHGRDADRGGEACPIFYLKERLELIEQGSFWLSEAPETPGQLGWDARHPRIVVWGRFRDRAGGAVFHVANTHFDHVGAQAREEGARLIVARLGDRRPLILLGDLNTRPGSPPYLLLTAAGLLDARHAARRPAYPSVETGTSTGFTPPPRGRSIIDYIFVTPPVEVIGFGVITENWDGLFPSDHRPIVADLRLPR